MKTYWIIPRQGQRQRQEQRTEIQTQTETETESACVCGEQGRQHPTSAPGFDQNEHPFVSSAALDPKNNESSDEHAGEPWAWESHPAT